MSAAIGIRAETSTEVKLGKKWNKMKKKNFQKEIKPKKEKKWWKEGNEKDWMWPQHVCECPIQKFLQFGFQEVMLQAQGRCKYKIKCICGCITNKHWCRIIWGNIWQRGSIV